MIAWEGTSAATNFAKAYLLKVVVSNGCASLTRESGPYIGQLALVLLDGLSTLWV